MLETDTLSYALVCMLFYICGAAKGEVCRPMGNTRIPKVPQVWWCFFLNLYSTGSIGNLITVFHIIILLHNPNLIAFVSNMQRQKVIIYGCLPSELFLISPAVGGPVFLVLAHVFIFLSSHNRENFVTQSVAGDIWWFFEVTNEAHRFSVILLSVVCVCIVYTLSLYTVVTVLHNIFWKQRDWKEKQTRPDNEITDGLSFFWR